MVDDKLKYNYQKYYLTQAANKCLITCMGTGTSANGSKFLKQSPRLFEDFKTPLNSASIS